MSAEIELRSDEFEAALRLVSPEIPEDTEGNYRAAEAVYRAATKREVRLDDPTRAGVAAAWLGLRAEQAGHPEARVSHLFGVAQMWLRYYETPDFRQARAKMHALH